MDKDKSHRCHQFDQLDEMRHEARVFLKQRLLFWALRWTIGFFGIWVILQFYPALTWLWAAGLVVALVSLAAILGRFFLLEKRLKKDRQMQQRDQADDKRIKGIWPEMKTVFSPLSFAASGFYFVGSKLENSASTCS